MPNALLGLFHVKPLSQKFMLPNRKQRRYAARFSGPISQLFWSKKLCRSRLNDLEEDWIP